MKSITFMKILNTLIYRTMIIQEFTRQPSKLLYSIASFLNELLVLKCGLLIKQNDYKIESLFERFLIHLIRPYQYFIQEQLELQYSIITFVLLQLIILFWGYLLVVPEKKEKKTYIQLINKYESSSTLQFLLIYFWKSFFLMLSEFLGLMLIEGCFVILFDQSIGNLFCVISSIVMLLEILVILMLQGVFMNQSLHYIPRQLNQIIQPTLLVYVSKLIKIIILCLFTSSITNKSIMVLVMLIINGLLELYMLLILTIKLDRQLIKQNTLMQCLIICVSAQQILNEYLNYSLQFLWIIVSILLYQSISMYYLNFDILQNQQNQNNSNKIQNQLLQNQKKLYYYQGVTEKRNSEYRLINKIFIAYHQKTCVKQLCFCHNEEMVMIKLENIMIKELIKELRVQIQQSQQQSSLFYIQYIQLLIQNGKCFEALNITQKVLNSFNRRALQFKKQVKLIKGQISLQHKILFKLLQQQILIAIKFSIQSKSSGTAKHQIIKQALLSLQQKIDSEKILQEQFNLIIKAKIDFLEEIPKKSNMEGHFLSNQAIKIIQQIEELKKRLVNNFQIVPTHNNQSLLLFFQIEILNDLINSQTINTMNTQLDDQEQIVNANIIYQEFVSQYTYVTFILKEEDNIEIIQEANKGIRIGQNKYTSFEEMVPSSLLSVHKYLMKGFFQSGLNKYYLNISQSFLQISQGVFTPIEMCMDISFDLSMNQLLSTAFIRLTSNNTLIHYFLLDDHYKVREISQLLYQKILEYPVNSKMIFYDQSIFNFIPTLTEKDFLHDRTLGLYQINFPMNASKSLTTPSKSSFRSTEIFQGVISVSVRKINQKNLYYILELTDLKSDKKGIYDSIQVICQPQIDVDEKEIINIPFDICSQPEACNTNPIHVQQLTSRLDSQRPLLFTSLGECLDVQMDNVKDSQSQISNKIQNSVNSRKKKSNSEEVLKQFDDQGSQISSVAAVRRSVYFKQFQIVNQLIFSKIFPINIKMFNLLYFLYIFAGIINLGMLVQQVQNFQDYQDLMALLSIKYDIYEPIESFLNTRYTILNLNQALTIKIINQSVYNELVLFPRSNLARGYDDLKDNIFDVISRKEFQSFLKDRYFESAWYIATNKGVEKNITFRSGILALLNYQYDFKLAYTVKTLQSDGPYFYYSYRNYVPLFKIFTQLNLDILDQLINQLSHQSDQLTIISAPFNVFLGVVSIFYFIYLIRQRRLKNKLLSLLYQQDNEIIVYEVQRLKQLQNLINSNYNSLYQYVLDVQCFDDNLKNQEGEFFKLINKKGNRTTSGLRKNRQIKIYSFLQLSILLINIVVLQLLYFLTLNSLDTYLERCQNTGRFYESLSNTGVDVLIIYAQREVLYRAAFVQYFQAQDIQDLRDQINTSLESIKKFSGQLLEINQKDYLLDDSSIELFDQIDSSNLCNFLPIQYQNVSTTICPYVLQGVLTQGLISTLNVMYNSITSEKQLNNFTNRTLAQTPVRELEGGTFTAKVIKELVKKLYSNIYNYTKEIQSNYSIIYICAIFIQLIFGFSIIKKVSTFEMQQINDLRKVVYLLPQSTLLFDDSFQRLIKIIIKQGQLI